MKAKKPYAFVTASHGGYGYGHLTVHVHDLFGYHAATLKITCQTGSSDADMAHKAYGWKYGLSKDYDVLSKQELQKGYYLMRRIERKLVQRSLEVRAPENFAEYALAVLQVAGVRKAYVNTTVNGGLTGAIEDLPMLDPVRGYDALLEQVHALENELIRRW